MGVSLLHALPQCAEHEHHGRKHCERGYPYPYVQRASVSFQHVGAAVVDVDFYGACEA